MSLKSTYKILRNSHKKIGLIILYDILFLFAFLSIRFLYTKINNPLFKEFYTWGPYQSIIFLVLLLAFESIIVICAYSFFKLLILDGLYSIFKKPKIDLKILFPFIKLNWYLWLPIIFVYFLMFIFTGKYFNYMLTTLSSPLIILLRLSVITILAVLLFVYFYMVINTAQYELIRKKSIKQSIVIGLKSSIKIRNYRIFKASLKIGVFSLIIIIFAQIIMKQFVLTDLFAYAKYYGLYKQGILVFITIILYIILLFNRIDFYQMIFSIKNGKK